MNKILCYYYHLRNDNRHSFLSLFHPTSSCDRLHSLLIVTSHHSYKSHIIFIFNLHTTHRSNVVLDNCHPPTGPLFPHRLSLTVAVPTPIHSPYVSTITWCTHAYTHTYTHMGWNRAPIGHDHRPMFPINLSTQHIYRHSDTLHSHTDPSTISDVVTSPFTSTCIIEYLYGYHTCTYICYHYTYSTHDTIIRWEPNRTYCRMHQCRSSTSHFDVHPSPTPDSHSRCAVPITIVHPTMWIAMRWSSDVTVLEMSYLSRTMRSLTSLHLSYLFDYVWCVLPFSICDEHICLIRFPYYSRHVW